jgi:GDP-4-dehydro-6-deoxy-D-mannose reductase
VTELPSPAAAPSLTLTGPLLVTGGGGFAGTHLRRLLDDSGVACAAPGRDTLDLLDAEAAASALRELRPAAVIHLAGFSSPRRSWDAPEEALTGNLRMTLNVLEGVRREAPGAVVVLVGSGQVYGPAQDLPIDESAPLCPPNPYAVSKAACDLLGSQYAVAYGLDVVRLRPFNHAGPAQTDEYVVSGLCRQVAEAEVSGMPEARVQTGDLGSRRDFTDVRDVARGYLAAITAEPGTYNVCSGTAVPISQVLELVTRAARIPVRHEVVDARRRSNEPPELRGSHARFTAATGWEPEIPLAQTVEDTLDWWRAALTR